MKRRLLGYAIGTNILATIAAVMWSVVELGPVELSILHAQALRFEHTPDIEQLETLIEEAGSALLWAVSPLLATNVAWLAIVLAYWCLAAEAQPSPKNTSN
jgi:hypothetical protein